MSKSELLSRCSSVLDELQSLMSVLYQIKDDDPSYETDQDSEASYWWDDSFTPLKNSCPVNSLDDSLSCDSLYSAEDHAEIALSDCFDLFSCYSLQCDQPRDSISFISTMSAVISRLAPANCYSAKRSKQRRRKKMMRRVHPELRRMWIHAAALVSPPAKQTPPSPMPTVDWSKVNKRFLSNIPSPTPIPVQSCSQDAEFYQPQFTPYGTKLSSAYSKTNPFGTIDGYRTTCGVISVPDGQSFHGYTWQDGLWLLEASIVKDKGRRGKRKKRLGMKNQRK